MSIVAVFRLRDVFDDLFSSTCAFFYDPITFTEYLLTCEGIPLQNHCHRLKANKQKNDLSYLRNTVENSAKSSSIILIISIYIKYG